MQQVDQPTELNRSLSTSDDGHALPSAGDGVQIFALVFLGEVPLENASQRSARLTMNGVVTPKGLVVASSACT